MGSISSLVICLRASAATFPSWHSLIPINVIAHRGAIDTPENTVERSIAISPLRR